MDLNPVHGVCLAHLPPLIAEFNLRTDQHTPYSLLAHETHSYIAPTRVAIKRNIRELRDQVPFSLPFQEEHKAKDSMTWAHCEC